MVSRFLFRIFQPLRVKCLIITAERDWFTIVRRSEMEPENRGYTYVVLMIKSTHVGVVRIPFKRLVYGIISEVPFLPVAYSSIPLARHLVRSAPTE